MSYWHLRIWALQGGLSRNKVAVGESAAGSPPNVKFAEANFLKLNLQTQILLSVLVSVSPLNGSCDRHRSKLKSCHCQQSLPV